MRKLIFVCMLSSVYCAPKNLNKREVVKNCFPEASATFLDTESGIKTKVVCETEFRDNCFTQIEKICRNSSTSEGCQLVDKHQCVDTVTTKCDFEKVLRNVSYTENVCQTTFENICELDTVDGEVVQVEESCVSKPVVDCVPTTRYQEEFIDEEVCRDIPIKDCESVKECVENPKEVCEDLETTKCEILPHEECKQVTIEDICDEKASMEQLEDYDVPDLKDILAIFGVTNTDNEISTEVKADTTSTTTSRSTTSTTSSTTTASTTSITTTTSTTTTTATTTPAETVTTNLPIITSTEFDISSHNIRQVDSSKIVFSDASINARNKELAQKEFVRRIITTVKPRVRNEFNNSGSQIFFPE